MVQLWQSRKKRSPAGWNVRKDHQQYSTSSPRVVRYKSKQAVQRRRWYGLFQSLSARQSGWSGGTRGQRNVARGRLFRSGDSNVGRSAFLGETSEQVLDCCSWPHTDIITADNQYSTVRQINIDIVILILYWYFTYGVPGSGSLLAVSDVDWPGVQTLLVPQLTGRLYGLTQLAGWGLAVEHVAHEGVLTGKYYWDRVGERVICCRYKQTRGSGVFYWNDLIH